MQIVAIFASAILTAFAGTITTLLIELSNIIMGWISNNTQNYWQHPIIQTIIAFYSGFCMIALVTSVLAMFFDIAEETMASKSVDYGTVFFNFIKAFTFMITAPLICSFSIEIGNIITNAIGFGSGLQFDGNALQDIIQQVNVIMLLLVAVLLVIATIGFLMMSLVRFAHMIIHLLTAIFYIPDIVRGNTASIGDWVKQMIAIAGTFVIQYLLFAIGISVFTNSDILLAMGMWVGMFSVPKILGKYGMSSGIAGLGNATMNMGNKAMRVFK